jgi:uncharacterized protein (TIGR03067 family)
MMLTILILLLGGSLDAEQPKDIAVQDRNRLAGHWKIADDTKRTEKTATKDGQYIGLVFTDNRLTLKTARGESFEATYTLKPDEKPKQITIRPRMGPDEAKTLYGIYELKGDRLRICWSENKEQRPRELKAQGGRTLLVLKRSTPP